jgi:hypothetical protein
MPAINLSTGDSAILYSRNEISERTNRAISKAFMAAGSIAAKLQGLGFDETKPETWSKWAELTPEEQEKINEYQATLIVGFVKSWSKGELPTLDSCLDLPAVLFQELANACSDEFSKAPDFSPDGVTDPKVLTAE